MKMGALGLVLLGQRFTPNFPASLANLAAWHDPSVASSVTLNGADVSQIADLSGNSRDAVQATGAQQPLYALAAIHGRNAITYTGANNDTLALNNSLGISRNVAGFTFFAVCRPTSLATVSRIFTIFGGIAGARFIPTILTSGFLNLGTRRLDADGSKNSAMTLATATAGLASFCCYQCDYAGGSATLQLDGVQETVAVTWTGGLGNTSDTDSSSAPNYARNSTNLFTGDMGEAAAYSRALSASEIQQLRNYCRGKWGTA